MELKDSQLYQSLDRYVMELNILSDDRWNLSVDDIENRIEVTKDLETILVVSDDDNVQVSNYGILTPNEAVKVLAMIQEVTL